MSKTDQPSKVIVITGASSGFGRGAAIELAKRGHKLVLAARRGQALNDVIYECVQHRGENGSASTVNAVSVECDVSCRADVEALADKAVGAFGRIDVWVNDAGTGAIGPFEQIPIEDHQKVIETNLIGTIHGCHAALRQFITQEMGTLPPADKRPTEGGEWTGVTGLIINVASELGKLPSPYYASYAASKHGVVGLSGCLRLEMRERGFPNIHVCTVCPEAHDTPFFQHAANYTGHETVALKPLNDPQKVVDAIVKLVEDDSPPAEVLVGSGMEKVMNALHKVIPGPIERALGHMTHKEQIEKAPASPRTRGAVHGPIDAPQGQGVSGGERAKNKRRK